MTTCAFAKTDMTPCVLRDGDVCYAMNIVDDPVCVGCGRSPVGLGRNPPNDWEKIVAEYKSRERGRTYF